MFTENPNEAHEFESVINAQDLLNQFIRNRFIQNGYVIKLDEKILMVISEDLSTIPHKRYFLKNCKKA